MKTVVGCLFGRVLFGLVLAGTFAGTAACAPFGFGAAPFGFGAATPTPPAAVTFASSVQGVSPYTNSIAIDRTIQGYTRVILADGASIQDTGGGDLALGDIRAGMLIEVTGLENGPTSVLASDVRILGPSAAPAQPADESLAADAVRGFLAALATDPSGSSSLSYTSSAFQAQVQSGTPVAWIAQLPDVIPAFNITTVVPPASPGEIDLQVTFDYAVPFDRIFRLIDEDGRWRIDRIAVP